MKLIILILMFTSICFAKPKNFYPLGATGADTTYSKKAKCEAAENSRVNYNGSFDITKKNKPFHILGLVDDKSSPKYTKQNISPCADFDSCDPLFQALDCSGFLEGSFAVMLDDFSEVYCAEPNGFNKKPGIVADATLKAAFDLAKAAKVSDKNKRKTKRTSRKNALKICAKTKIADFTASIQKNCLRAIARELMRLELLETDL